MKTSGVLNQNGDDFRHLQLHARVMNSFIREKFEKNTGIIVEVEEDESFDLFPKGRVLIFLDEEENILLINVDSLEEWDSIPSWTFIKMSELKNKIGKENNNEEKSDETE